MNYPPAPNHQNNGAQGQPNAGPEALSGTVLYPQPPKSNKSAPRKKLIIGGAIIVTLMIVVAGTIAALKLKKQKYIYDPTKNPVQTGTPMPDPKASYEEALKQLEKKNLPQESEKQK